MYTDSLTASMTENEKNTNEYKNLNNQKKFLIAFVDTENISPHGTSGLISLIDYKYRNYGYAGIWCYGIGDCKSGSSLAWKKICNETSGFFKWKEVKGPREKNRVDEAIKKDIEMLLNNPKNDPLDLWIIATSDGDYESAVRHIKEKEHKVVIAYSGALSNKLKNICDEQYYL